MTEETQLQKDIKHMETHSKPIRTEDSSKPTVGEAKPRAQASTQSIAKVKEHFDIVKLAALKNAGKPGHNPYNWLRDNVVPYEKKIEAIEKNLVHEGATPLYEDEVSACLAITTSPDTTTPKVIPLADRFAAKE